MDEKQIDAINTERLETWKANLNHFHATAVCLIGKGQDRAAGEVHVDTSKELSDQELLVILRFVIACLEAPKLGNHGD